MATEQLQFSNDSISLLSTGVASGTYTGTLTVNYSTGAVTGSIVTSPALGSTLPALTYQNFAETFNPATGVYTISSRDGVTGLGLTTFSISFSGTTAPATVTSSIALTVGGPSVFGNGTNTNFVTSTAVCFTSGTLIRTDRGNVAVEALAIGDRVITASGEARPIRWLGHRVYDCRNRARPQDILPVRIRAGAFGEAMPSRDLVVSPGHSVCVDVGGEVLIPATALINGTSVVQEQVETVTYWHVELDSHDIVFAEDLASESYVEMGNRLFFVESGTVALHATPDAKLVTHDDFCRPFHLSGPVVEFVQDQLAERAAAVAENATALAA